MPSHPAALTPALRHRIGDAIDALLLLLDAADGDCDLEPSFGCLPDGDAADECEEDDDQDMSEERAYG